MYDHYLAIDFSINHIALARTSNRAGSQIKARDFYNYDLHEIRHEIKKLKGRKILTIEETTGAHWLYAELIEVVDKIIICDPYRNKLLLEGPKDDKIDAIKLVRLLKADMLKEVYHPSEIFLKMRKLTSAYEDLIKSIVRAKNQKSAFLRSYGIKKNGIIKESNSHIDMFIMDQMEETIENLEGVKEGYEAQFASLRRKHRPIADLTKVPGIGDKLAVKIVARVVEAGRFRKKGHFLSYCGLVKHNKITGGKLIGRKNPRYSREMKYIFKVAASTAMRGRNEFSDYYRYLVEVKHYSLHNARHAVSRKIAVTCWGVLKSGHAYEYKGNKYVIKDNRIKQMKEIEGVI